MLPSFSSFGRFVFAFSIMSCCTHHDMQPLKLQTRKELAEFLGITNKLLSYVLYVKKTDFYYSNFEIPKTSGGVRHISASSGLLKVIQQKLNVKLSEHLKNNSSHVSHGFIKGRSIFSNAHIHVNKKFVLQIDLKDFFDSFHFGRVAGFFQKNINFQCSRPVAICLAQLCCYKQKLPQGAPSSPTVTNLICQILDRRILNLSKRYKVNYTRYADDLTFSTNRLGFQDDWKSFYDELKKIIVKAGFEIHESKTRLTTYNARQVVTGLTVNKKINSSKDFIKNTRAMADHLYRNSSFNIGKELGTINQLEGRFVFISQVDRVAQRKAPVPLNALNSRDREYQKFLFYKYFFANDLPLVITEGKTDVIYLKSALKNLYEEFPSLIEKKDDGSFIFKLRFLNRSARMKRYFRLEEDGADSIKNIYFQFSQKNGYYHYFKKLRGEPKEPIFLLFDHEKNGRKPLQKFLNIIERKYDEIENDLYLRIMQNAPVFLLINPINPNYKPINDENYSITGNCCDWEIESLFLQDTRSITLKGKKLSLAKDFDTSTHFGKAVFASYISKNYLSIDFSMFRKLFKTIEQAQEEYRISLLNETVNKFV